MPRLDRVLKSTIRMVALLACCGQVPQANAQSSVAWAGSNTPGEVLNLTERIDGESREGSMAQPSDRRVPSTVRIPMLQLAAYASPSEETASLATPEVVAWLGKLIRQNLPPTYEDDRKWGNQQEVWDGIELRREGLRIETKRKKKMVNSGTWTRYAISFVDPDNNLHIQFQRLETLPDGRIAFAITVDCALDIFGRLSQWVRDVQVISISANADAACRLTLAGTVQMQMNPLKLPPDISIDPNVDTAHVELTYYRVRRVSQIGGDFAKLLGNSLRGVIDEKLEEMNGKLVHQINDQLAKHSDQLEFSPQEWLRSKIPTPVPPLRD